jgi:uncharacterized protein
MTLSQSLLLFSAALAAGMINSVAGGGTLVSYPALVWLGYPQISANATNTLALAPGALSSLWGYRGELKDTPQHFFVLLIPSFIGGILGAVLLKLTPAKTFEFLVPFLILFATLLFMAQDPIKRWLRLGEAHEVHQSPSWMMGALFYQFLVGIYGGYFGAGIGILTLAVLGVLGLENIHQMNALKNIFAGTINLVAALYFIYAGLIHWPEAILMAVGAIVGGYGAAGLAQRMGQRAVRRCVIVIGLAMAVSLLIKR